MVDVLSKWEGDGETERSEKYFSRPGCAHDYRRGCRDRLKIVEFLQASGRRRLLFPVFVLQFFTQEAAALAGVPGLILLFAEISCYV